MTSTEIGASISLHKWLAPGVLWSSRDYKHRLTNGIVIGQVYFGKERDCGIIIEVIGLNRR